MIWFDSRLIVGLCQTADSRRGASLPPRSADLQRLTEVLAAAPWLAEVPP